MTQQARNLRWKLEDDSIKLKVVIHDRDKKFAPKADSVFKSGGGRVVLTPLMAPRVADPACWVAGNLYNLSMAKVTFELDERVRRALKQAALNMHLNEKDIHERALRQYLGLDIIERLRQRPSELTEEQALELANEEVHAARRDREKAAGQGR
ncbi:MAG: hypothetical protein ABI838_08880 [Chloroflexota bacterium]